MRSNIRSCCNCQPKKVEKSKYFVFVLTVSRKVKVIYTQLGKLLGLSAGVANSAENNNIALGFACVCIANHVGILLYLTSFVHVLLERLNSSWCR